MKQGKIQKPSFIGGLETFPLKPLQPQNYPKYCNSVTLLKYGDFAAIYWLQFLVTVLIRVQKNCNQLRPSFGYNFIINGYNFIKNHSVTVTSLIYRVLSQIIYWLQNYNFLGLITENDRLLRIYQSSHSQHIIKKIQICN